MTQLIGVVIAGVLSLFVMPVLTMALASADICVHCINIAAPTFSTGTSSVSTNSSSASTYAPGHGGTPPGQGGTPPGQAKPAEPDPDEADPTGLTVPIQAYFGDAHE